MLKKRFRFLSAVVSTLFLIVALTPAALAAGVASAMPESFEQSSPDLDTLFETDALNYSKEFIKDSEFMSVEEFHNLRREIAERAAASITPELLERVAEIQRQLETVDELRPNLATRSIYDQQRLVAVLNSSDGMSVGNIATALSTAALALNEAQQLYTDTPTEMKRDAFRHMTWNFRLAKAIGEGWARVATSNHEWATVIQSAVNAHYNERFIFYANQYWWLDALTIRAMAQASADAFAITYRDGLIQSAKNSLTFFNNIFSNANIMDFWNNRVGRRYASSNPNSSTNDVFTMAWNNGELIKNETNSQVTSSRRSTLHSTNWWRTVQ